MTDTCDMCDRQYDYKDRHVAVLRRPSDPAELCSVMAVCPPCGTEQGWPTPASIEQLYEDDPKAFAERYGEGILWLTM